jgi:hypothetical protein
MHISFFYRAITPVWLAFGDRYNLELGFSWVCSFLFERVSSSFIEALGPLIQD